MLFGFRQTESVFLSLAQSSAEPLRAHLDALPPVPASAQYATFLRTHDELAQQRGEQPSEQGDEDKTG